MKPIFRINYTSKLILFLLLGISKIAYTQDSTQVEKQEDIVDIAKKIYTKLPFQPHQKQDQVPENKLIVSVLPAPSYTIQTRLQFSVVSSLIYRRPKANVSSFISNLTYTQNNQMIFDIRSNYWTKNNSLNLVGDWRIMHYPQSTYGLGIHTSTDQVIAMDYDYLRIHQTVLKKIAQYLYGGIGYHLDYHWNISSYNEVRQLTRISRYGYGVEGQSISSGLSLSILFDNRHNSNNPDAGFYGNIIFRNNATWLGSDHRFQSLLLDVRKYFNFPRNSNNILAFWSYNHLTLNGNPPFLDLPSTGWDMYSNSGRGFIQGRFRGNNWLYLESEYRFNITKNHFLGGIVFANVQTVSEPIRTTQFDSVVPAIGTGLRLKMNKLSRVNLAIDFGLGVDGSQTVSFNLGEVF